MTNGYRDLFLKVSFLTIILTYSDDSSKNGVWFKLHKYFHENKKNTHQ